MPFLPPKNILFDYSKHIDRTLQWWFLTMTNPRVFNPLHDKDRVLSWESVVHHAVPYICDSVWPRVHVGGREYAPEDVRGRGRVHLRLTAVGCGCLTEGLQARKEGGQRMGRCSVLVPPAPPGPGTGAQSPCSCAGAGEPGSSPRWAARTCRTPMCPSVEGPEREKTQRGTWLALMLDFRKRFAVGSRMTAVSCVWICRLLMNYIIRHSFAITIFFS